MDAIRLTDLVKQKLSIRTMAKELNCSFTNVRHHLRKNGLQVYRGARGKLPRKLFPNCESCGETDASKFYGKMQTKCRICHNLHLTERKRSIKRQAIAHLGGKCQGCGYSAHPEALAFHHLIPEQKDVEFTTWRGWAWSRIKTELQTCALVCHNCHSEIHAGHRKLNLG